MANDLGNLVQRCCGPRINLDQVAPPISEAGFRALGKEEDLYDSLVQLPDKVTKYFDNFNFSDGLELIFLTVKCANIVMTSKEPWVLKKQNKMDEVYLVLGACIETLRVAGIMIHYFYFVFY